MPKSKPGATGDNPRAVPPKSLLVPPQTRIVPQIEDYALNKVTGSMPPECSSRLETPKLLVITPEFMSKNCFFAYFAVTTFFFLFFGLHPRIGGISLMIRNEHLCFLVFTLEFEVTNFLFPPKNCVETVLRIDSQRSGNIVAKV